jgi:ATP/maltotriose-dependent transcriptional regulator MalT
LRPQYDADFASFVGQHEFNARIPIFDETNPREEVWRELDPLATSLALLVAGLQQEILGDQADALALLQRAAQVAPDSDVIQYFLGQEHFYTAQRGRGDVAAHLSDADAAFAEAFRLNPDNARARIGQAAVHFLRAQNLLNEATAEGFAGDVDQALDSVRLEAQEAQAIYSEIAAQPEQTEQYGVPVASIARQGLASSRRVLAEVSYRQGDSSAAEALIDEAIDGLQGSVTALDTDNDPRLAAQTYQTLGGLYELRAFFLRESGDDAGAEAALAVALDWYRDCEQQGVSFPFDTYMVERIVDQLCRPRAEALLAAGGGG